jgi:hypothetical protein
MLDISSCCPPCVGELSKLAIDRKLVRGQGKTPENSMASAMYRDMRKRGPSSLFIK